MILAGGKRSSAAFNILTSLTSHVPTTPFWVSGQTFFVPTPDIYFVDVKSDVDKSLRDVRDVITTLFRSVKESQTLQVKGLLCVAKVC